MTKTILQPNRISIVALLFILFNSMVFSVIAENKDSQELQPYEVFKFEIIPANDSSLQKITLTESVYNANQQSYIGDLNITDSSAISLPFELEKADVQSSTQRSTVTLYPLFENEDSQDLMESLQFKYDEDNRLIRIENVKDKDAFKKVVGYLLDFGEVPSASQGKLEFVLSRGLQTMFLRFDIVQSNNLKDWRDLAKDEVLAQLIHQDNYSEKNQINLSGINSRFLRLDFSGSSAPFLLYGASFEYQTNKGPKSHWGRYFDVPYNEQEKGFVTSVSRAAAFQGIQFDLPNPTAIFKGRIYTRANKSMAWQFLQDIDCFKINHLGKSITNDEIHFSRQSIQQIKIVLDYPTNNQPIKLKMNWQQQSLLFFANGNPPYQLVIGEKKRSHSIDNSKLLNNIKSQMPLIDKEASFGKIINTTITPLEIKQPIDWKNSLLWLVLIVGVLVMAWMAKGLMKQL